jgi:redox-sensitive bicupin YhaK (pirin superfamily)
VNLPQQDKMMAPAYQEFAAADIPAERREDDMEIRTIAGTDGAVTDRPTEPIYLDITLSANAAFSKSVPATHNAFLFVIEGSVWIENQEISARTLAILDDGDTVSVETKVEKSRFLLIAGRKLDEPIARAGPFVMNTQSELKQAINDYQSGRF